MADNTTPIRRMPDNCLRCGNEFDSDDHDWDDEKMWLNLYCAMCGYGVTIVSAALICEWDNFDRKDLDATEPYYVGPEVVDDLDEVMEVTANAKVSEVTADVLARFLRDKGMDSLAGEVEAAARALEEVEL